MGRAARIGGDQSIEYGWPAPLSDSDSLQNDREGNVIHSPKAKGYPVAWNSTGKVSLKATLGHEFGTYSSYDFIFWDIPGLGWPLHYQRCKTSRGRAFSRAWLLFPFSDRASRDQMPLSNIHQLCDQGYYAAINRQSTNLDSQIMLNIILHSCPYLYMSSCRCTRISITHICNKIWGVTSGPPIIPISQSHQRVCPCVVEKFQLRWWAHYVTPIVFWRSLARSMSIDIVSPPPSSEFELNLSLLPSI